MITSKQYSKINKKQSVMIQLNMNTNASTKNDNNYNNINNNNNKLRLLLFSSSLLPSSGPPRARSRQSGTRVQRCRRGNLYKNNYSYHQRYYYHYYHCLYEGRSGVPIHAKSPTPSLNKLRPCFDFADIMLWNGKLQKQLTRSRAIG